MAQKLPCKFTKGFFSDKKVVRVELDPDEAFADIDRENNVWEAASLQEGETGGTSNSNE